MASVNSIGVPGQPATNLTAWQAAVRDALDDRDETVDTRLAKLKTLGLTLGGGWSGTVTVRRTGSLVALNVSALQKGTAPGALETICTVPLGYRPPAGIFLPVVTFNSNTGSATPSLLFLGSGFALLTPTPAPAQTFNHTGAVTYYTPDAWPA